MRHKTFRSQESEWLRSLVELSMLFLIAVIMLRGFFLEGYLISTGSMAPGLLGLHKQVECPSCGQRFAYGVSFDSSIGPGQHSDKNLLKNYATCPNCGQVNIAVAGVPANHGDQLLVHKGVFEFRAPERWETVVFRNPADPGEAYVKRVAGLPGETLQIRDGDLFIEGRIARKDVATQRDIRIPVFDMEHIASSDEWQMPWRPLGQWEVKNGVLSCQPAAGRAEESESSSAMDEMNWLRLRNWRWSGGTHVVETPVSGEDAERDWLSCVTKLQDRPVSWMTRLSFDRERGVLQLHGVMPYQMQQDLVSWADSETFRNAVYRLGALSHISPITDRYGYNSSVAAAEFPVKDLMLHVQLNWAARPDQVIVDMPVENQVFRVQLDLAKQSAQLHLQGKKAAIRSVSLSDTAPHLPSASGLELEVSNFDHRILVTLNGSLLFAFVDLPVTAPLMDYESLHDPALRAKLTAQIVARQSRLALGIRGGNVSLPLLKLYRDVYYTPGHRRNGVDTPLRVDPDSYFVQGDNSPVSSDSRNWAEPFVPHKLLVGKPFVVHLPSKPGKLMLGGFELPIRIPDFQRIRYIH